MGNLRSLINRAPKRLIAVVAVIAAAIIVPAAAFAWGPSRPTFTWDKPADYVVFNSMTNNPVHGDERNFMQVREATASNETYADSISLQPGREYVVYMYYHNNASTTYNDAAHNYAGVAKGAYVKALFPATVPANSNGTNATGYVGAANATPKEVWDEVAFKNASANPIALQYISGSATIHNFGSTNGQKLSDSIISTGASIGYNALDGTLPGCNEFSGYVTFRLKATQSNFSLEKQVRVAGQTEYKDNVTAKPGDTLDYRIEYKNTGSIQQNNVVLKDTLPNNVSYVTNSTTIKNAANPNGKTLSNNLTGVGINIGDYAPGSNAFVKFQAKVATADKLACGVNTLTNTATVQVGNETKSDTATVTVTKECPPSKITVCELATKKIVTINENQFDPSKYSKDLTKCQTTPPELPKTGPTETILGILGIGAIVAALGYYIASRKALGL